MTIRPRRLCLAVLVFTLAPVGCSPSAVKIKGKILKGGQPMIVSEDTYVTLSFMRESSLKDQSDVKSYSAKFDHKTGTYAAEMPPGKYKMMLVIAPPSKRPGQPASPNPPIKPDTVYEFTKSQDLDVEVPVK